MKAAFRRAARIIEGWARASRHGPREAGYVVVRVGPTARRQPRRLFIGGKVVEIS